MSYRFEPSCLIPLPNIVTNKSSTAPPTGHLSTHIWDLILAGNIYVTPLSPTFAQGFSPLLTLFIDPYHGTKSATYPVLLDKVFSSFQDVLRFINGCKWFLMLVCHPTYCSFTIVFKGLSFLEDQITASNLTVRWQDPTILLY